MPFDNNSSLKNTVTYKLISINFWPFSEDILPDILDSDQDLAEEAAAERFQRLRGHLFAQSMLSFNTAS